MNRRRSMCVFALGAALLFGVAAPGSAQVEITARGSKLRIGGRLQTQLATSSTDQGPAADFLVRRSWLTFDATLNDWVSGRLQYDIQGSVKDAYVRFSTGPDLRVDMGHFKRAFDLFLLQSSADISVIERDGRIPGIETTCAGVGNVCSLTRLTKGLDYSDRDVGLRVGGKVGPRFSYQATLTNGTGSGADENGGKSTAARAVLALSNGARLGADVSVHDHLTDAGDTRYASAWGVDLEVGSFEAAGVHLQAGVVAGDNWKATPQGGSTPTFLAAQGIVSYYAPRETEGPIRAVEPLARVSWADPDTGAGGDGGLLVTPGFMLYFARRNKIGANVDVYSPRRGPTEWSLKVQSYFYF